MVSRLVHLVPSPRLLLLLLGLSAQRYRSSWLSRQPHTAFV